MFRLFSSKKDNLPNQKRIIIFGETHHSKPSKKIIKILKKLANNKEIIYFDEGFELYSINQQSKHQLSLDNPEIKFFSELINTLVTKNHPFWKSNEAMFNWLMGKTQKVNDNFIFELLGFIDPFESLYKVYKTDLTIQAVVDKQLHESGVKKPKNYLKRLSRQTEEIHFSLWEICEYGDFLTSRRLNNIETTLQEILGLRKTLFNLYRRFLEIYIVYLKEKYSEYSDYFDKSDEVINKKMSIDIYLLKLRNIFMAKNIFNAYKTSDLHIIVSTGEYHTIDHNLDLPSIQTLLIKDYGIAENDIITKVIEDDDFDVQDYIKNVPTICPCAII